MTVTLEREGAVERLRELVAAKVPFLHQGRTMAGMDCIGALAHAFAYTDPLPPYPENPINGELETELERLLGPPVVHVHRLHPLLNTASLLPLDILSMQYRGPIRHVAVVVPHVNLPGELSVVHTDAMLGRVTEHRLDGKWLKRIVKVWRP